LNEQTRAWLEQAINAKQQLDEVTKTKESEEKRRKFQDEQLKARAAEAWNNARQYIESALLNINTIVMPSGIKISSHEGRPPSPALGRMTFEVQLNDVPTSHQLEFYVNELARIQIAMRPRNLTEIPIFQAETSTTEQFEKIFAQFINASISGGN
jgi:alpha-D-ribose 1-methylphosphonate 5-triphosphate diphosphatase PhnM